MTSSPKERRESGLVFSSEMSYCLFRLWHRSAARREQAHGKDNRVRMMRLRAKAPYMNYRTLKGMEDPFFDDRAVA